MATSEIAVQENCPRTQSVTQWIWALTMVVAAIILLSSALRIQRVHSSSSWPTTTGTISVSDLEFVPLSRVMHQYRLQLLYDYNVDGTRYESHRVSFAGSTSYIGRTGAEKRVHRVLKTYAKGDTVTVRYHPSKPGVAVLESDIPTHLVKTLLLGLCMTLLSAAGFWRRWTLQTDYFFKPHDPDAPMTTGRFILGALGLAVCLGIAWIWWELIKKYAGL